MGQLCGRHWRYQPCELRYGPVLQVRQHTALMLHWTIPLLYYETFPRNRVLHAVLRAALEQPGAGLAEARRLAASRSFQDALLNCAVELVTYAASGEPTFPELTSRLGRMPQVLDLWDAAGRFGSHVRGAPAVVCSYLGLLRLRIAEELAWRNGSLLFQALSAGGGGGCADGDRGLVSVRAPVACAAMSDYPPTRCMVTQEAVLGSNRAPYYSSHLEHCELACVGHFQPTSNQMSAEQHHPYRLHAPVKLICNEGRCATEDERTGCARTELA